MNSEPYHPLNLLFQSVPLLIAVGGYVFFIVASLAIARSRTGRLSELVELGALGAATGMRVIESSERYLLCTQMGRLICSFGAGFCLAFVTGQISRLLVSVDGEPAYLYGLALAAATATVVMLATLVLVQVSKAFTLHFPERTLCMVALPLRVFYVFVGPILIFIHNTVERVLARFKLRVTNERDVSFSTDDISEIVKLSTESGTIEESEQQLIEGVVDFAERVVREVMTPRKDIVWADETSTTEQLIALCTKEGVSRVLVCRADLDDVRGMILAKDLLKFLNRNLLSAEWRSLIRSIHKVPNTKPVDDLLYEFRSTGTHLAVVLDEHGGVDGVVTLEDLVEEIVGDIFDETDAASERELVLREVNGEWIVDGGAGIDQLPEDFGISPSEGQYETIAGYLLSHVGRLPEQGESFEIDKLDFKVLEVHRHRIVRLSIRVLPQPGEAAKAEVLPLTVNGSSRSPRKTVG